MREILKNLKNESQKMPRISPDKKGKKKYDDWEIDDAVHTLMKSEEIKGNPQLMGLVSSRIKEKKKEITSLEQQMGLPKQE